MLISALQPLAVGQKLIEYQSGMGSRDPNNSNVWILYDYVEATHEGMILTADSAHFDMEANSFTAYRNVEITLTDTTFIYGDRLYYDGVSRVLNIWADTVVLIDGSTILKANHLTYERNESLAYYDKWGHAVSGNQKLDSEQGYYNSAVKEFYIYDSVRLSDTTMLLLTDFLKYNTITNTAHFETPTVIYSDSSIIRSENGEYNTETRFAISFKGSRVDNPGSMIAGDTIFYDEYFDYGRAMGNVILVDSVGNIVCTGQYGENNRAERFSYVCDSAHVFYIDDYGDSLFMHADTIYLTVDEGNHLNTIRAHNHVKLFRRDFQGMCDSAFYNGPFYQLTLFTQPVLWLDHYQFTADTIEMIHDSVNGMRLVVMRNNCFTAQQVDRDRYNQIKGRYGTVYFKNGEPDYADIYGNAQMAYYLTEIDDSMRTVLMGVNVGRGTDIRIYFDTLRKPMRVVTYDKPELEAYPEDKLPEEWRRMQGFEWRSSSRPRKPEDVFVW